MSDSLNNYTGKAIEEAKTADVGTLDALSIGELKIRVAILNLIIKAAQKDNDPRVVEPIRQLRVVNTALVQKIKEERRAKGIPEPEPVVIEMQPAKVVARSPFDIK